MQVKKRGYCVMIELSHWAPRSSEHSIMIGRDQGSLGTGCSIVYLLAFLLLLCTCTALFLRHAPPNPCFFLPSFRYQTDMNLAELCWTEVQSIPSLLLIFLIFEQRTIIPSRYCFYRLLIFPTPHSGPQFFGYSVLTLEAPFPYMHTQAPVPTCSYVKFRV